jgi:hypothetical protein
MKNTFTQAQLLRMGEILYEDSSDPFERKLAKRMGQAGRKMELRGVLREKSPDEMVVDNHFLKPKDRNKYRIRKRRK